MLMLGLQDGKEDEVGRRRRRKEEEENGMGRKQEKA